MLTQRPWFKAKTFGWGWGVALTWQGWAVYAAYALLVLWAGHLYPPRVDAPAFIAAAFALTALLVAVCWLTGEKPGRR